MVKHTRKIVLVSLAFLSNLIYLPGPLLQTASATKLNRNQTMLINLKNSPESAGYYLVNSFRTSKIIAQDLERAANQIIAVDKTYAKYRRRPDDRFLQTATLKVTAARETAKELEEQLADAYAELKSAIEESLITEEHFPTK